MYVGSGLHSYKYKMFVNLWDYILQQLFSSSELSLEV